MFWITVHYDYGWIHYEWLPFPPPGDLSAQGIEPRSPALQADFLPSEPPGKPEGLSIFIHITMKQLFYISYFFICHLQMFIATQFWIDLQPSPVTQTVKNLPAMQETQETQVQSLGWEDPLEKAMATHSSILAWRIDGQKSLVGYSQWGLKEWDTTEWLTQFICPKSFILLEKVHFCSVSVVLFCFLISHAIATAKRCKHTVLDQLSASPKFLYFVFNSCIFK